MSLSGVHNQLSAAAHATSPSRTSSAGPTDLLPMGFLRDALAAVLHSSAPSPFQLVFSSHPAWPRPAPHPPTTGQQGGLLSRRRELRISCLDSSFNPPTLAHRALATASYTEAGDDGEYDAHLLLLSVKNVDKVLSSGDANYECVLPSGPCPDHPQVLMPLARSTGSDCR